MKSLYVFIMCVVLISLLQGCTPTNDEVPTEVEYRPSISIKPVEPFDQDMFLLQTLSDEWDKCSESTDEHNQKRVLLKKELNKRIANLNSQSNMSDEMKNLILNIKRKTD